MFSSQEDLDTAMSLQGDDAVTLVNVLDQVGGPRSMPSEDSDRVPAQALEIPNMELDLRKKSAHVLQGICGSQTILPHPCIFSDNISKEGDVLPGPGGFAQAWKGHHHGNRVCIKVFRSDKTEDLPKIKQVRSKRT